MEKKSSTAVQEDNGHPDADEVWNYLKTNGFRVTDDFPKFDTESAGEGIELTGDLLLEVHYGGQVNLKSLTVFYEKDVRRDRDWHVAPETVDRYFEFRLISRPTCSQVDHSGASIADGKEGQGRRKLR